MFFILGILSRLFFYDTCGNLLHEKQHKKKYFHQIHSTYRIQSTFGESHHVRPGNLSSCVPIKSPTCLGVHLKQNISQIKSEIRSDPDTLDAGFKKVLSTDVVQTDDFSI